MIGTATAETFDRRSAWGAYVRRCATSGTSGVFVAASGSVPESLALEAAEWVRNIHTYIIPHVSDCHGGWETGSREGDHIQVSRPPLAILECGQTANTTHTRCPEFSQQLLLRRVLCLWGVHKSLACVPGVVEFDRHFFVAEDSGTEECCGLTAFVRLNNERTVGGCFDFKVRSFGTADGLELFHGPENIYFPEGHFLVCGLDNDE